MSNQKQLVMIPTKSIVRFDDPNHPLYDVRAVGRKSDIHQQADFRLNGIRMPIEVVRRETTAGWRDENGTSCAFEAEYGVMSGNGRHVGAETVGIDLVPAFIVEPGSLSEFRELRQRENSHRDDEPLAQQVEKARLTVAAKRAEGIPHEDIVKSVAITLRMDEDKVKALIKFADPTKTSAPIREMINSEEIDYGAAKQAAALPVEQQPELAAELVKVQSSALAAAAESGKLAEAAAAPGTPVRVKTPEGDTATLKVDQNGTPTVKPSQDTVMNKKAKVQKRAAPDSTKTEAQRAASAPVALDAAMINAQRARIVMLRKLVAPAGVNYADFIAGAEALAALLTKSEWKPADDASDTVKAAHAELTK